MALVAVAEGLSLARAGGADPVRVWQPILGGFAGSRILELHGQRMDGRRFEVGGSIVNQVQDLDVVLDIAASTGIQLPLTERMRGLLGRAEGGLGRSEQIRPLSSPSNEAWPGPRRLPAGQPASVSETSVMSPGKLTAGRPSSARARS